MLHCGASGYSASAGISEHLAVSDHSSPPSEQELQTGKGSAVPTGLLHCNLPLFTKSLYEHAISVPPPAAVAIGKNGDQFQTAEHKEYPPLFGKALAFALGDGLLSALRRRGHAVADEQTPEVLEWLMEVVATSAIVREESSFLPDFQGR